MRNPIAGSKLLLRSPITWLPVLAGLLLGLVLTYAYMGAFVDPIGHLTDMPVGLVNLDHPVDVAGRKIDVGEQFTERLLSADTGARIALRQYGSAQDVTEAIRRNEIAGAIVVPEGVSQGVADIAVSAGKSDPVMVDLLRNDGAGALQPPVFDRFAETAVAQLSDTVSKQLTETLEGLGVEIAPGNVGAIADPVVGRSTDVIGIGNKGGRGLPPLYVAIMLTLTGILAASALHIATGTKIGTDRIETFGRTRRVRMVDANRFERWIVEALVAVPVSVLGGAAVLFMTRTVLGAHVDRPWLALVLGVVTVLATTWFTLALLTMFGLLGDLLVILLTTIFGVPSARGVYPAEALPRFFRVIGEILPLRYVTDGLRSVFYFDGLALAGLRGAWIALGLFALLGLLLGFGGAAVANRRDPLTGIER